MTKYLSGFAVVVLGLTLALEGVNAQTLHQYEMCLAPDNPWYTAHGSEPMLKEEDGFGDVASGDYAAPHWAGLQNGTHAAPLGTGRFVDSGNHGNDGYIKAGFAGAFTVDMRVGAEAPPAGSVARSMSLKEASGNGRGIRIIPGSEGGNHIRLQFVDGSGNALSTVEVNKTRDDTILHMIRFVVANDGRVAVYDLETDTDPGEGYNWAFKGDCLNLGGSGWWDPGIAGGNVCLGSLGGNSTSFNKTLFDWVRIDDGAARGSTGPIIPPGGDINECATVPCGSDVLPAAAQTATAFAGEAATPGSFDYQIFNIGASDVNWTVQEAGPDGAPFDYTWLGVAPASGSIASGGPEAAAIATITAEAETVGLHTGYLRFEDGCAIAPLSDSFVYPAGVLLGNDGWATPPNSSPADAADGTILVTADGAVQLLGSNTPQVAIARTVGCDSGVVSVKIKAKAGAGSGHSLGSFIAYGGGQIMGWWMLQADKVTARDPIHDVATELALGSEYTELEMRINTAASQTEFWYGEPKTHLVTYPFAGSATASVEMVGFMRIANGEVVYPNEYLYLDDLSVAYIGAHYRLRQINLNVIGCSFDTSPRSELVQTCGAGTATRVFTITNNGAFDIDSFTVTEVDPVNGNPYEYPWLTLSDTTGLTIPRNSSVDVTATIESSLVSPMGEKASIQVSANCGATPIRDTLVDALTVSIISVSEPQIVRYMGDTPPLESNWTVLEGMEQPGSGLVDDVDAQDGKSYFIQDSSSAKTKYRYNPDAAIDPAKGATIVGRLRTTVDDGGGNPANHFGNLFIWASGLSCEVHWGGPNGLLREAETGQFVWMPGDANYHIIRMTVRDEGGTTGKVVRIYFDENPKPALQISNATLRSDPNGTKAFGWGVGGTLNAQEVYFDWVAATDAGAFAPGEEGFCLGCNMPDCTDECWPAYCREPAGRLFADVDGDLDVDMADFAMLQLCYTYGSNGSVPAEPEWCACLDHGDDDLNGEPQCSQTIDAYDLRAFLDCATGPNVPWSQDLTPDCKP